MWPPLATAVAWYRKYFCLLIPWCSVRFNHRASWMRMIFLSAQDNMSVFLVWNKRGLSCAKLSQQSIRFWVQWSYFFLIVDGWIVELLNYWIVDLLNCWMVKLLKCQILELLSCWIVELLNCWSVEALDCWIVELLNCWSVEVLKCWIVKLLNGWIVELLNC